MIVYRTLRNKKGLFQHIVCQLLR